MFFSSRPALMAVVTNHWRKLWKLTDLDAPADPRLVIVTQDHNPGAARNMDTKQLPSG
jgi:hypothetical protein